MAFCVPLLYPLTSRGPVFSWSLFPATPGWASNSQTFQAPSICGLQVDTELLSLWSKEMAFPACPHICDILACWPHCPQVCPQACPEAVSLCQSFSYISNRQLRLTLQGSQSLPQQCWAQSSGAQSPAPLFPPQLCPFPQGPLKSQRFLSGTMTPPQPACLSGIAFSTGPKNRQLLSECLANLDTC